MDEAALGHFLAEYFGFLVAVTVPQMLIIDPSFMRGMDNGSVRCALPQRNSRIQPRGNESNTLEWIDSLRIEHRRHANLLDQYVTSRVGLHSDRRYTLCGMQAAQVWRLGISVIPGHNFACCHQLCMQLCFQHTFPLPQVSNFKSRIRDVKLKKLMIIYWTLLWAR